MNNLIGTPVSSSLITEKLENSLADLSSRLSTAKDSGTINLTTSEIYNTLTRYFSDMGGVEFIPELILDNDTPSPRIYNNNLLKIHNDLVRFYKDLKSLSLDYVSSYNYAQLVSKDILDQANGLASIVVDLNILNNFDRGDTIVAGDDFNTLEFVDAATTLGSDLAELIPGGGGLTLTRVSAIDLVNKNTSVEIIPITPVSNGAEVNVSPTPGNLERFYEGNFYNFLGLARPEGGEFNFRTLTSLNDTPNIDPEHATSSVIIDIGASEEQKKNIRSRMFDKNPDTFWECEYIYSIRPIASNSENSIVSLIGDPISEATNDSTITLNIDDLNRLAKSLDRPGIDLTIDIIITLPESRTINFVSLNPILFSAEAFPEIVDIATAGNNSSEFTTVDGWETIKFPKYLTQEANEFLTDSQSNAILAPSKAAYKGQGVFNFPPREAKKIKIRVKSDFPVSNIYERTYTLVTSTVKATTTVTTTTTKRSIF